jgi:hypothetical protein
MQSRVLAVVGIALVNGFGEWREGGGGRDATLVGDPT